MSSKTSRKGAVPEEKDKRPAESPGKDLKKKMAAIPEKEKQADKPADKQTDKPADRKTDKPADRKTDKPADKKPETDKVKEDIGENSSKDERNGNAAKKQNGGANGTQNGGHKNGTEDTNGTVSEEDDIMEDDEIFPELTYEDSDLECFDLRSEGPSRSFTRRSQAKVTRTPETPRPASDKAEKDSDDSKDSKVLKLKEDAPPAAERKLRSTDSPKPESKKETPKKDEAKKEDAKKDEKTPEVKDASKKADVKGEEKNEVKENGAKDNRELEVVVVLENIEEEPRKSDTNFSKSRVKVSPYRRSMRLADQTNTSIAANYTGNNTTMETDISETSFASEGLDDSAYLSSLRNIRGRRSYKLLQEYTPTPRPKRNVQVTVSGTDQPSRPTAPVVGRKRKPDSDIEVATEAFDHHASAKRIRLFDKIARPFRRSAALNLQATEIVGINTDLPLTSPISIDSEPETLKAETVAPPPLVVAEQNKRCIVM